MSADRADAGGWGGGGWGVQNYGKHTDIILERSLKTNLRQVGLSRNWPTWLSLATDFWLLLNSEGKLQWECTPKQVWIVWTTSILGPLILVQ